jgi:hypothetical protein
MHTNDKDNGMKKIAVYSSFVMLFFIISVHLAQGSYPSGPTKEGIATELKGDLLTVDIRDVPLREVLTHLSDQHGITFLLPSSLGEEKIMVKFANLTINDGLDKILKSYNRIFIYQKDDHSPETSTILLKEVRIFSNEYTGKAGVPLVRIARGLPQVAKAVEMPAKTSTVTPSDGKEKESLVQDMSANLKSGNREDKLDAIKTLKSIGTVRAMEALSFALRDKDTKIKDEAVNSLRSLSYSIVDEGKEAQGAGTDTGKDETEPDPSEKQGGSEPQLTISPVSDNGANIELSNEAPVRAVQLTLSGVRPSEVRTTSRTEGFFVKADEKSGNVVLISMSGKMIAPGNGPIAEVVFRNGAAAAFIKNKVIK